MIIPFDFEAFLLSLDVQGMTTIQVGAYTLLLGYCAVNKNKRGYIKNDVSLLKKITRMNDEEWKVYAPDVLAKFEIENDLICNKRLLQSINESLNQKPKKAVVKNKSNFLYSSADEVLNLIDVDFSYQQSFIKWIRYKQTDKKFTYKSISSLQEAYNNLVKLSDNNFEIANEMVSFSIANGYVGIFKPRNNYGKQNESDKRRQSLDNLGAIATSILQGNSDY